MRNTRHARYVPHGRLAPLLVLGRLPSLRQGRRLGCDSFSEPACLQDKEQDPLLVCAEAATVEMTKR